MNALFTSLRAPFLAGSMVPVFLGSAVAYGQGFFSIFLFVVTVCGVCALHLGANLLNDYFDAEGSDPINVRVTPFSGGSRVIQEGEMGRRTVLGLALLFLFLGVASGAILVLFERPLVLPIGLFGLFSGWAYSAPPFNLMSRGWGEILIFFAFGPAITLGAYYALSGSLGWPAFFIGFPQGCFIAGVIWINQFPDYEADMEAGKRNLVVRLGRGVSRVVYALVMLSAFGMVAVMTAGEAFSGWILLSFIALPLALKAVRILWANYLSHERTVPAQALTIQVMVAHGFFLTLGLILDRFL